MKSTSPSPSASGWLYTDPLVDAVTFRAIGAGPARGKTLDARSMSKLKLGRPPPGEGRGDEGRGASGGSRNARFRRSVEWLALWLRLSAVCAPLLLFLLCVGDDPDPIGELRDMETDCRRDSRPAMYADERSVAGAVTAGWGCGSSGRSPAAL